MSDKTLVVRELETDREVDRVDVTGKSDRIADKVLMGMLINMDTDRYYVKEETA